MAASRVLMVSLLFAGLFLGAVGCGWFRNPATGKKSLLWITPSQEQHWGQQVYSEMEKKPGFLPTSSREQARLERVTRRVIASSDARDAWDYKIRVLDTKEVNAMAAPGGFVFATRGLMDLVSSDDELAGVMAHEIGHVAAKHTAFQMQKALVIEGLATGGAVAASTLGSEKARSAAEAGAAASAVAGQFLLLKYSRDDEYQADKLGVDYSYRAGYDPEGLVTFFEKLERQEPGGGSGGMPSFFSTHPPTPDRINRVEREIARVRGEDRGVASRQ